MGLFDFITGGSDPRKQIEKHLRKLTDVYRQSHERYLAMDELAKIGTDEAYTGLMERFTVRVNGPTVDEEEKTYCYELLGRIGEPAVPAIIAFIGTNNSVYFPLRALRDIAGDDRAVDTLLAAMDDCDPGYHEGLERLREIVSNLRDFRHERVHSALVQLLQSRSDEIRFYALDGLAGYPAEEIVEYFAARLLDPEETQRVKALAAELSVEHGFEFKRWAEKLGPALGDLYKIDNAYRLAHKTG